MISNGGIPAAHWPTSWGDMLNGGRVGGTGDPGIDAFSELGQYVPALNIESIILVNGETGILECFWAKPNADVKVLNFDAVLARYFDKFERLLTSANAWLKLPIAERQNISWVDPLDDGIKGYKIRKCVALYVTSAKAKPQYPVDEQFLRFKEYAYQRIVGRPIFSRACFKVSDCEPKELFDRFLGPLFFRQSAEIDCFTWPWQSSLEAHSSIGTVTLVFDVRMSTLAYMHTSEKLEFIRFISEVKQLAKKRIMIHGGVFSMDTGDGVAGHFCNEISKLFKNSEHCHGDMYVDAIKCACATISDLKPIFLDYKSKMDHLLDGLAPSIGLHFSDAHWVNVDGSCEAVGDNVIWAHRICAVAAGDTVLYSQAVEKGLENARKLGVHLPKSKKVSRRIGDIPKKGRWVGYQAEP